MFLFYKYGKPQSWQIYWTRKSIYWTRKSVISCLRKCCNPLSVGSPKQTTVYKNPGSLGSQTTAITNSTDKSELILHLSVPRACTVPRAFIMNLYNWCMRDFNLQHWLYEKVIYSTVVEEMWYMCTETSVLSWIEWKDLHWHIF